MNQQAIFEVIHSKADKESYSEEVKLFEVYEYQDFHWFYINMYSDYFDC